MVILIKAVQLILSLSILVILHEAGHFFFARLFHTRVEKFYLFFNPKFSLFKFKKGETEYGIGWIPLGGYVKIAGMIDESMDREQMKKPPQPWEFRSKPAWQRLLIMLGGVMVNFLLAMVIYGALSYTYGDDYVLVKDMKYGIEASPAAEKIGFKTGDKILAVNGKQPEKFSDIQKEILLSGKGSVEIERDGKSVHVSISDENIKEIIRLKGFMYIRSLFQIDSVLLNSNAARSGLKKEDQIVAIDSIPMQFFDEIYPYLQSHKNEEIELKVRRNNTFVEIPVQLDSLGRMGVLFRPLSGVKISHQDYNLLEAVPIGISKGWFQMKDYLRQFKLIFNPKTEAYKSIGSFGTIGSIFPAQWDWRRFWSLTAFLSIILGVLNLLPIPALDGGHAMFTIFEMITGKKPSDRFMEYAQFIGFALLMLLMIYALRNDFVKFFM